jgi:pimeloyl-ACP methyl ester carboxylesterase
MRYLEYGSPNIKSDTNSQKPHILPIHGLGASDKWSDIPCGLAKSYHTIAIDLIGFGKSDTSNDVEYSI